MAGGGSSSLPSSAPQSARASYHGRDDMTVWNILAQIALIQLTFYLSFLVSLLLTNFMSGASTSGLLDQMLAAKSMTLSNLPGWSTTAAFVISSMGPVTAAIVMVVGRSRKCLDFAATTFCIHLVISTAYDGLPKTATWWVLVVSAGVAVTTVGELLCARNERMEVATTTEAADKEPGQ